MVKSMTGYGHAELDFERFQCKVEVKSLNSKFFELNVRLPRSIQNKEIELRRDLQKKLERGTVSIFIHVQYKNAEDKVAPLNLDVAEYYLNTLNQLAHKSGKTSEQLFNSIFEFPNILSQRDDDENENDYIQIQECIHAAFIAFDGFRKQEGKMLYEELLKMVVRIEEKMHELDYFENERIEMVKERLNKEIGKLSTELVDRNRFEQELIYFLEKLDISEEKARLKQHCNYFRETMLELSSGKKLGFIAQEMGREINTIGSKSNHSQMQRKVVEMKDELEKIKEQINNIL
jgi:uncharacterized protein (TIGR00255 family)